MADRFWVETIITLSKLTQVRDILTMSRVYTVINAKMKNTDIIYIKDILKVKV